MWTRHAESSREGLVDNIVIDHLAALLQSGIDAKAWSLDDPHFHAVVDDAYIKESASPRATTLFPRRRNPVTGYLFPDFPLA